MLVTIALLSSFTGSVVVFFHRLSVCQGLEALGLCTFFLLFFLSFAVVCLRNRCGNPRITGVSLYRFKLYFLLMKNVPYGTVEKKKCPHRGQ